MKRFALAALVLVLLAGCAQKPNFFIRARQQATEPLPADQVLSLLLSPGMSSDDEQLLGAVVAGARRAGLRVAEAAPTTGTSDSTAREYSLWFQTGRADTVLAKPAFADLRNDAGGTIDSTFAYVGVAIYALDPADRSRIDRLWEANAVVRQDDFFRDPAEVFGRMLAFYGQTETRAEVYRPAVR